MGQMLFVNGVVVGMVDTPELAKSIASAMNEAAARRDEVAELRAKRDEWQRMAYSELALRMATEKPCDECGNSGRVGGGHMQGQSTWSLHTYGRKERPLCGCRIGVLVRYKDLPDREWLERIDLDHSPTVR